MIIKFQKIAPDKYTLNWCYKEASSIEIENISVGNSGLKYKEVLKAQPEKEEISHCESFKQMVDAICEKVICQYDDKDTFSESYLNGVAIIGLSPDVYPPKDEPKCFDGFIGYQEEKTGHKVRTIIGKNEENKILFIHVLFDSQAYLLDDKGHTIERI